MIFERELGFSIRANSHLISIIYSFKTDRTFVAGYSWNKNVAFNTSAISTRLFLISSLSWKSSKTPL